MADPELVLCPFGCGKQVMLYEKAVYEVELSWITIEKYGARFPDAAGIVQGMRRHEEPAEPISPTPVP